MSSNKEVDALQADIEVTRERLAADVDELSHRADIPARAKERVRQQPRLFALIGAATVAAGGALVWLRRRKGRR